MSPAAAALVTNAYGADPTRLEIVPHGVPDLPLVDAETMKPGLGVEGRDVLVSFGLLGPGKGYELAIDALPEVVAAHPTTLYVIVGATQPDLVRDDGESYRDGLVARVRRLGMQEHVRFEDRFVGRVERTRWLQAADVVVTPYANLEQTVSSTLACAMGAGRMVVSAPYPYAREMLADGRGILVEPDSPAALAAALTKALRDPALRTDIGRRAYEHTRHMVWSAVGGEYQRVLRAAAGDPADPGGPDPRWTPGRHPSLRRRYRPSGRPTIMWVRAPVAQWIERWVPDPKVAGSSPVGRAISTFSGRASANPCA